MQVSQGVWMPERADGKGRVKKGYSGFYRKRLAASLQQAQVIFSFSEQEKEYLISQAAGAPVADKILVVPPAAGEHFPPGPEEKETLKETYAEGKEYFFAAAGGATQEEIVELLKAFSLFKKRQRSNMQLVLTGKDPTSDKDLGELLATYKYRGDVHWAGPLSEEDGFRLAGAAYALVFPFGRDTLGTGILDAWNAGVPVITTDRTCLPDTADTVLYARPGDPAALAGQLMLIYKDESLRNRLIINGTQQGQSFSLHHSAGLVRAGIRGQGSTSKISKSAIKN
jgi:glycosyltransferase involved in cell wall biosynthesis